MIQHKIVASSGGPDSTYLLYLINKHYKNKFKIVCLHVNYNFRKESNEEEQKLKLFCKENNIIFFSLFVDQELKNKYLKFKNKQDLARKIRYDYFAEKLKELKENHIYIAHNKDDFIETALMQYERSKDFLFYGIKKTNKLKNIQIIRPILEEWKEDILKKCKELKIPYSIDESNFEPIYERNRIRIELSSKTLKEKEEIYNFYSNLNNENKEKNNIVEQIYKEWKLKNFNTEFFIEQKEKYKNNLIYLFLINLNYNLNINFNKINSIKEFIVKNRNYKKEFRIQEALFIKVENKILRLIQY